MKLRKMGMMVMVAAAIAALLWVTAGEAFARAGGGQSSSHSSSGKSSGSSSSSKSSSGSSSKSYGGSSSKSYGGSTSSKSYGGGYSSVGSSTGCGLLGLGLGSIFGGAGFVVFIIIAIVIAVLRKASAGSAQPTPQQSYEPEQTYEQPEDDVVEVSGQSSIDSIKAKDPNFSERVFLDKAQTIFFELQKAWMARDLAPIRPYVSDGVHTRWRVFIDQYKRDKQINMIKDPVVNSARVARVQEEGDLDSITIRMDCSMADAMVSESNPNQIISGSLTDHKPFTEYWTFVRKASIQTRGDAKAKIDKCPNCGAPLKISAAGNCEYCDTLVHSTEYDWILSQITQEEEWR